MYLVMNLQKVSKVNAEIIAQKIALLFKIPVAISDNKYIMLKEVNK